MALGINDLSIGISAAGVRDYYDQINAIAIKKAKLTLVAGAKDVSAALQAGWQGAAQVNFEQNIGSAIKVVCNALDQLDVNLKDLFAEVVEEMAMQDEALVERNDNIISF